MFGLPLVVFLACLPIICRADVQVSAPNCTDTSFSWSMNSLGQNPCTVAAYLMAPCSNGAFYILPLLPQQFYHGPSGPDDGDLCKCNTVTYCLISACVACQGEQWTPYAIWSANCTSVAPPRTYPESILQGTRVPNWAFNNPAISGSWNETLAQYAGDLPEVTGNASIVPTSTSSVQSTSLSGGSDTGVIAGSVVGGVIGVALIAGLVTWFTIRRIHARSASPVEFSSGQGSDMAAVPYSQDTRTPKLYDPSDPSTYPPGASTIFVTDSSKQHFGSSSDLQPTLKAYNGLPEL